MLSAVMGLHLHIPQYNTVSSRSIAGYSQGGKKKQCRISRISWAPTPHVRSWVCVWFWHRESPWIYPRCSSSCCEGGSDGVILGKGERGDLHACVCSKASHPTMSHMGIAPLETDTPSNKGITAERTISGEAPQVRRMPRYMSSFEVGLN